MSNQKSFIPVLHNKLIFSAVILLHLYTLVLLPFFLLPLSAWWAISIVPFLWLNITQWGLIHEAIHKNLHPELKTNELMGRALAIAMGVSFNVVRFGHLMHHKLNRKWQSELVPENNWKTKAVYYCVLLGGLYVQEVFSSFMLSLLPRKIFLWLCSKGELSSHPEVGAAGERIFYQKNIVALVRKDTLAIAILYAMSFIIYGKYWPLLLAFIVAKALLVSFMDNIYHYGTMDDNSEAGKDLALPNWAAVVLLNSNYHDTHHRNPEVTWINLPRVYAEKGYNFKGRFFEHGLMQFKGPIKKLA